MLRFRPILMTTAAAIFGAVPLAMSFGNGGEIRRPLGLAVVGGLIVSQLMTLHHPRFSISLWRASLIGFGVRDRLATRTKPC